jgi:hypothetical protein
MVVRVDLEALLQAAKAVQMDLAAVLMGGRPPTMVVVLRQDHGAVQEVSAPLQNR